MNTVASYVRQRSEVVCGSIGLGGWSSNVMTTPKPGHQPKADPIDFSMRKALI
jgi:hypothetical protein